MKSNKTQMRLICLHVFNVLIARIIFLKIRVQNCNLHACKQIVETRSKDNTDFVKSLHGKFCMPMLVPAGRRRSSSRMAPTSLNFRCTSFALCRRSTPRGQFRVRGTWPSKCGTMQLVMQRRRCGP